MRHRAAALLHTLPPGAPRRRLFCGRSAVASSTTGAGAAVEPRGRGSGVLASGSSEDPDSSLSCYITPLVPLSSRTLRRMSEYCLFQ